MNVKAMIRSTIALSLALTSVMPAVQAKEREATTVKADANANSVTLGNGYLKRTWTISDGHILTSSLENKRANTTLNPQTGSEDFIINRIMDPKTESPEKEILNAPEYIIGNTDSALDRTNWADHATLTNAAGTGFAASEVAKLFNDNLNDNVDNYLISGYPMTLEIDLGEAKDIAAMSVNKRPGFSDANYGKNGTMGQYEIQIDAEGNGNWQKVHEGEFTPEEYNLHSNEDGTLHNIGDTVYTDFNSTVSAKKIRIIQKSAAFGTVQEFTSSEIKLYSKKLKSLKVVEPNQIIDKSGWNATITNGAGVLFPKASVDKLFDNDLNTYPNEYQKSGNPFTVDIDLGNEQTVSSFSIDKRPGFNDPAYGTNGTMGKFEVYVSDDGNSWNIAGKGEFTQSAYHLHEADGLYNVGDRVYVNLLKAYTTRYIRIKQLDCSMGSAEEFTSAELNFYSDAYQGEEYRTELAVNEKILSSTLTYQDTTIDETDKGGKKVTINYQPITLGNAEYTISQVAVLEPEDHYMRTYVEIAVDNEETARIDYIDQDHFVLPDDAVDVWCRPDDSKISSMWIGKHELMLGQPIYANGFFMGSEFPAADTIIKNNETQIRYYSGKTFSKLREDNQLTTDGKFVSWQNVVGAARDTSTAVVQTDFFEYIEEIATPTDFRKQYNSWYDNMMDITDDSIADSFLGAEAGLSAQGVEPLDSYVVDDGWNNYYSGKTYNVNGKNYYTSPGSSSGTEPNQTGFWEFNAKFPNELYTSSSLTDKFGATFGVWVGPQGGYNHFGPFALYLEDSGTADAQYNSALGVVICTGSRKYLKNFEKMALDFQKRFNVEYWKWDGFASRPCNNPNHDHMAGGDNNMYFTSDMWEGWIDLFNNVRKQNPNLFINATCYVNLSPWLLQWVNTIWVQDSGDTGQLGTGERHEQKIYYRDQVYYKLYKQNQIQFPMKNIYNHDPIYGVSDGSKATTDVFREYLMANAVRGTAFWELYYSPSLMNEAKWQVTADVLDFAENNHDILKNAKLFGNQPQNGVYGYSSWNGTEGIISFTNPLDTEAKYSLTINSEIGAISALENASVIQIEPYTTGMMKQTVSYNDTFDVTLAPHETKIFQFNHKDTSAPVVTNVKNIDDNTVRISFNKRVNNDASFTINNNNVASVTLMDDYRTYEIVTVKPLCKKADDITIESTSLHSVYGTAFNDVIELHAYKNAVIAELTGDQIDAATGKYFSEINEAKKISDDGIKGTDEFGISFNIKTTETNQTILEQGKDIKITIDNEGYIVAKIGNKTLSSKEEVTTVTQKATGNFANISSTYIPTQTDQNFEGTVNDGEMHAIVISRESNGMLKLYENGQLRASLYDNGNKDSITNDAVVLGSKGLNAVMSEVKIANQAMSYEIARENAANLNSDDTYKLIDRTGWTATACSEEAHRESGDSDATSAIDGNTRSHWHSNWHGEDKCIENGDHHWIKIDFGKEQNFKVFEFTGRGGSSNGNLSKYNLYAIDQDGNETKIVSEGTFNSSDVVNTKILDQSVSAYGIKLEYLESVGNYASAAEINVYAEPKDVDLDYINIALKDIVKKDASNYTSESYALYEKAYQTLMSLKKAVEDGATTNDILIEKLIDEYKLAETALISTIDLNKAIAALEGKIADSDEYTEATIKAANELLDNAKALLINGTAESIADMVKALNAQELISTAELNKAIAVFKKKMMADELTAECAVKAQTLLESAKALIKDGNSVDITEMISKLNNFRFTYKETEKPDNADKPDRPLVPINPIKPNKPLKPNDSSGQKNDTDKSPIKDTSTQPFTTSSASAFILLGAVLILFTKKMKKCLED